MENALKLSHLKYFFLDQLYYVTNKQPSQNYIALPSSCSVLFSREIIKTLIDHQKTSSNDAADTLTKKDTQIQASPH